MPTVPQEHRRLNSHVQRPFIDKVAPAPAMAERGMPPRLCSCCPCLLECHPPTQQIFTKLLLYTRHWENRDNPRQIWFPPSQGPGMPRKLLLILQNPTPEPSLQCETSLDFPKSEAASSPVLSQPPVTLVVEQREREHRPRTRPVHRTLCWAPHRRCPAPGSQQLRKEETVPLVTDENTDSERFSLLPQVTLSAGKAETGNRSSPAPGSLPSMLQTHLKAGEVGRVVTALCPQAPARAGRTVGPGAEGVGRSALEPSGAALPASGPRWRCAHSCLPGPLQVSTSAPRSMAWKDVSLLSPASSAWEPLGPVQPLSLPTGVPFREVCHRGGASGWANSPSPKCYGGERGTQSCAW